MSGFYHLRGDTLAGIKTSALFLTRSMAHQPLPEAVARLNEYMKATGGLANPEGEAFKFYYANHAFSVVASKYDAHEPLPTEALQVARGYVKLGSDLVARLAYYVLLITTREMRHLYSKTGSHVLTKVAAQYGQDVADFIQVLTDHSEDGAGGQLRKNAPASITLGRYLGGLSLGFHKGGWGGSYGGPKWGVVTDTLLSMVEGKTSPEMFADVAFTLAHNGGPIFNKGLLYTGYSQFLYKLLDVQRSGQVPQLYADGEVDHKILSSDCAQFIQMARNAFPEELGGFVDWYKVEKLGAIHQYPHEKAKQNQKHGVSAKASSVDKLEAKKFYITPTEWVKMVDRKEAA